MGNANDAELVTLFHAFDARFHLPAQYKEAIAAKLERYKKSGVEVIGWQPHGTGETPDWADQDKDGNAYRVSSGVFVIWHTYKSGAPKRLVYQWNGRDGYIPGQGRIGGKNLPDGSPGRDDRDYKGAFFVPDEFVKLAIERHQKIWGGPPASEEIDDTTFRAPKGKS